MVSDTQNDACMVRKFLYTKRRSKPHLQQYSDSLGLPQFFTLDEVEYFIHLSKKFVGMPPMISTDLGVKQTVWCCLASKRYVCLSRCHKSLEAGS